MNFRKMKLRIIGMLVGVLAALAIWFQSNPRAADGVRLDGAWSQKGEGAGLTALVTFHSDGTIVGTNANHPSVGPNHGVWVRTGAREFQLTWWHFRFDEHRKLVGRTKVRGRITLGEDPNRYSARYQRDFLDLEDRVTGSQPRTAQGFRITIDPLN